MVGFRKGTPVLIGDNLYKNIEDIKKDDVVISYNEETHELVPQVCVNAFTQQCENVTTYTFDNGTVLVGCDDLVFLTPNGYKEHLEVGDRVITINGEATLLSLEQENGIETLYELDIEEIDNYIAKDIVVHNALATRYAWVYRPSSGMTYPSPCAIWTNTSTSTTTITKTFQTSYDVISISATSGTRLTQNMANSVYITLSLSTTDIVASSDYQFSIDGGTTWVNYGTLVSITSSTSTVAPVSATQIKSRETPPVTQSVTITGTNCKSVYLSTSSTATSGSASGTLFNIGATVYGFITLNDDTATYRYLPQSNWTNVSGRIYRVGSITVSTTAHSFSVAALKACKYEWIHNSTIKNSYIHEYYQEGSSHW